MKPLTQWLRHAAEGVAAAMLVALFAVFLVQIAARYVFNVPMGWTVEVCLTLWLWLVFWGGGIDTQQTLPFGSPEAVREQVRERMEIFGPSGGFVFNAIHNVQARTPVENLLALFEAVRDYRMYS